MRFPVVTHQVAVDEDASSTAHPIQLLPLFQRASVTHQVAVAEKTLLTALLMHVHNVSASPAARQTQSRRLKSVQSHPSRLLAVLFRLQQTAGLCACH